MRVLLRLLKLARPYTRQLVLAWLSLTASGGFVILTPQLVSWAIDVGLRLGRTGDQITADVNWGLLSIAAVLIVASALARGIFAYGQQYLGEWIGQTIAYDMRNMIYDRLQRLSYAYHDKAQTGQLMSRATVDVESIRMYYDRASCVPLHRGPAPERLHPGMFIINAKLAFIAWAFVPASCVVFDSKTLRLRRSGRRSRRPGRSRQVAEEALSGVRVVKAPSARSAGGGEVRPGGDEALRRLVRIEPHPGLPAADGGALAARRVAIELVRRPTGDHEGDLSLGELSAFDLWLNLLQLPDPHPRLLAARSPARILRRERIFEILDAQSAVKEAPDASSWRSPRATFGSRGAFGYDAISPVARRHRYRCQPGKVIALLGPAG